MIYHGSGSCIVEKIDRLQFVVVKFLFVVDRF